MVRVFRWDVTVGGILGTGLTVMLALTSFMSRYSSKFKMIFFDVKCSEFNGGLAVKSTGGTESLGPPVGGIILAQPVIKGTRSRTRKTSKKNRSRFMSWSANLLDGSGIYTVL